jgi:hypothetical protein
MNCTLRCGISLLVLTIVSAIRADAAPQGGLQDSCAYYTGYFTNGPHTLLEVPIADRDGSWLMAWDSYLSVAPIYCPRFVTRCQDQINFYPDLCELYNEGCALQGLADPLPCD